MVMMTLLTRIDVLNDDTVCCCRLRYENDAMTVELKLLQAVLNQNLIQDDDSEDVYDSEEVHEEL